MRPPAKNIGYLTILHDYEADYSLLTTKDISYKGVSTILDMERLHNVCGTYNIVGKLMEEVPDLVSRIKSDGHEIASHSYSHNVMTTLSKNQMADDLRLTKKIFNASGLQLKGFRSPQSKWNFKLMYVLLETGVSWNAERDPAKYPYIIAEKKGRRLLRMPVTMSDWLYKSHGIAPHDFYGVLTKIVDRIAREKTFGSICFHPWVHGEDRRRLDVFNRFLQYTSRHNGVELLTCSQMYQLCSKGIP